jgi:hypothetical protein
MIEEDAHFSGSTVTLAGQADGPDASAATRNSYFELSKLISRYCVGSYSPEVREFAPIFRIDGSINQWNREGCGYLRRNRKEKYITIDIFVPISRWKNRTEREIREYFASQVREALSLCVKRLQKDKTPVDGAAIMRDYERVVEEYLRDA